MRTTTFSVTYSAIPALIVVKKDGDQTRITPLPLSWPLVLGLMACWLNSIEDRFEGQVRSGMFKLNRVMTGYRYRFAVAGISVSCKIILGLVVGMTWQRSLAWGFLSI